jgi:hypothetical protein
MSLFSDWNPLFFFFKFSSEEILQAPLYEEVVDRSWNPPDLDKLVAYLRGCRAINVTTADRPIVCAICGEVLLAELWTQGGHSDGLWFWGFSLFHYVQYHHVRLPDRMVEHIRMNQYRPPDRGSGTEGP